ncbi:hypothetical protein [Streptomyces sp. NPDC003717]|uniref:hypothetical protein n=1 Tax=Streptomyces sp. NPDC003717 TaxID=3154276 RepID=UPI0033A6EEEF
MSELLLTLDHSLRRALDDLADAQGRPAEAVVEDALRVHLDAEGRSVRAVAERLATAHTDLLRRLGE